MTNEFDDFIEDAGNRWGVPDSWIRAVIDVESSWNPGAYRAEPRIGDASYGLMQLLSRTARALGFTGNNQELFDPATNIDLGTKLLGQLRDNYGDDFRRVYSAYNSGKPDLWETSSQVAANVGKAITALTKYVTAGMTEFVGAVVEEPAAESTVLVGLLVVVVLWAWTRKRK
jgi:soluble lytic murein transglycosylase-like protein